MTFPSSQGSERAASVETNECIPIAPSAVQRSTPDFLAGGGEMGARIRAFDWASTPLGPVEDWPQSLKTIVRIMLTSRQPIWIGWGPELIKLYNDPYKAIVGGKHPGALGQPASVVWSDIWADVGPRLRKTLDSNEGTYDESLLLIMERYGYPEETYYTFSYSPVPGDEGGVGGIICANTDDTARVIGERQTMLLRTLAAQTADAHDREEACRKSLLSLEANQEDLPFALLYLWDASTQRLVRAGMAGIAQDHPAAPVTLALDEASAWPVAGVLRDQHLCLVEDLSRFGQDFPRGPWQQPVTKAVVLPIAHSGQTSKAGVLIVGLNPLRRFDEHYQGFLSLVAGQIASSLTNAQAYEEERTRAAALEELDRAKTLFFSNISHELRTPLTLMLGPIEDTLAEASTLSEEVRQRMEILHRNALRLLKLVNTLLDFSRLEAGRIQAVYEPVDLALLTADLASSFRSVIEKAGMTLTVDCPPLETPVYVDRAMWEKIVLNLLSNAFKYTLQGEISVCLTATATSVELAVSDTGVGISEEALPHLFERFYRVVGTAGRSIEGTGIGLSLVQELVKLHKGSIVVESQPGEGTTFRVSLPLGSAHLPTTQLAPIPTPSQTVTTTNAQAYMQEVLGLVGEQESLESRLPEGTASREYMREWGDKGQPLPARILFADDNADMRAYVSRLLSGQYRVETVCDGQAALASAQASRPALILADVMMPGLDGFQLLAALRADPQTRGIPVILLSARAGEEAKVEGLQAGADDYLTKPFSARELLARIEARLEIEHLRQATERAVREEREQLYALFEQAPSAIAVLQGDELRYELANPRYQQVFGRSADQLLGQTIYSVFPELEGQGVFGLLEDVLRTGVPYLANELPVTFCRETRREPETGYFAFVVQPLYGRTRQIERIMLYAVEVTEQVKARQQLEALSRQKDEFLGIASHELKTPVTSLKGYTQLLQREMRRAGDERVTMLLAKMDAQVNKLTNLITDLLDVTKMESGHLLFQQTSFEWNALIYEIIEEVQRTTARQTILPKLAPSVTLVADRDRLGQVLTNLLTNAIKYAPDTSTILVTTTVTETEVLTSVQDFGIGIPREKQDLIFERFFRVEGERQSTYPGLGLGLYISAEFIKRHHGRIWVESDEGQGTTITFALPLSNPASTQDLAQAY